MNKVQAKSVQLWRSMQDQNLFKRYTNKSAKFGLKLLVYITLIELGFIFALPLLFMISKSSMSVADLLDETIQWIPSGIHWDNYVKAYNELGFLTAVKNSFMITVIPMIGQVLTCAIAGYGLGRYSFPGRNLIFGLVLLCMIIPPQTTIISVYAFFSELGWTNTYWPFIVPAFTAQGLRGALFMLIFTQFFRGLPRELDEAARIDGAGALRVFGQIMLPLAKPAIFVVAVFSLVWHWNDNYAPGFFMNKPAMLPLSNRLDGVAFNYIFGGGAVDNGMNEGVLLAACVLIVLPLFVIYVLGQKYLVEGIERTGLAGD